jgi:hypothetical protein
MPMPICTNTEVRRRRRRRQVNGVQKGEEEN